MVCFAGDALINLFAEGGGGTSASDSAREEQGATFRAVCCALRLRNVTTSGLSCHIGMSTGMYSLSTLGGHHDKWVQVLSGPCMRDVAACVRRAGPREVVASRAVTDALSACGGLQSVVSLFSWERVSSSGFTAGGGREEEGEGDYYLLCGIEEAACLRLLVAVLAPSQEDSAHRCVADETNPPSSPYGQSRSQRGASLLHVLQKFLPTGVVYAIATSPTNPPSPEAPRAPSSDSQQGVLQDSPEKYDLRRRSSDTLSACSAFSGMSAGDSATEMDDFSGRGAATPPPGLAVLVDDESCAVFPGEEQSEGWIGLSTSPLAPPPQLTGGVQPVSVLFMKLHDYQTAPNENPRPDAEAAESHTDHRGLLHLQPLFLSIQRALFRTNGFLRQFIVDDKGCVLVAVWSAQVGAAEVRPPDTPRDTASPDRSPPSVRQEDQSRVDCSSLEAVSCALEVGRAVAALRYSCSISVTSGLAYCGPIGSPVRQEYAALGHTVNRCARMMCSRRVLARNQGCATHISVDYSTCSSMVRVLSDCRMSVHKGKTGEWASDGDDVYKAPALLPTLLCDTNGLLGCGVGHLHIMKSPGSRESPDSVYEVKFECTTELSSQL